MKDLVEAAIRESGRDGQISTQLSDGEDIDDDVQQLVGDPPVPAPKPAATELAVPEHSHVGESQSNGMTERAVQLVEDQARVLKAALEDRLGCAVPLTHAVMHWLIRHAAYLLTKFHVGGDHLVGYQRLHGKMSQERIAEFGEHVLYYIPKKRRGKFDPKWRHGVFLGRS